MPVQAPFSTITEMFVNVTDRMADKFSSKTVPAITHKVRGNERMLTHRELRHEVDTFANGLLALGVTAGDRIGIISENRPEWMIADHAILSLGAADVPIFPNLTSEQAQWIYANAGVSIVIVSNEFQLKKILRVADVLPVLRNIIVMKDGVDRTDARVISFRDVQQQGERYATLHPEHLAQARTNVKPDNIATIIYTSGTTGTPKGVMLTHANLVFDLLACIEALPVIDERDVILSYLPLCHSFERIANYFMFACGTQIVFAESIETLPENMRDARPTIVPSVPRMFERMHKRILENLDTQSAQKQKIFWWAVRTGKKYKSKFRTQIISPLLHVQYALADKLVFAKLRARIGGRIRFFVSGGAALSKELGEFFDAAGIAIIEGYGMTESSPVISVNPAFAYKFGTVGKPIPGVEVKIAPDGEILTRGGHVMLGYWNDENATREAIDTDGWLHTGDIGAIDSQNYLSITDRKKDLFVSSGGKNIAPQHIENLLLDVPYIDQVVLVGDHKPFITALIVPEFTMIREAAEKKGLHSFSNEELTKHSEIIALIEKEINTRQSSLANFERVRRFTLLPEPFTIESGDLTPTLKVKRSIVTKKFAAQIERMYSEV